MSVFIPVSGNYKVEWPVDLLNVQYDSEIEVINDEGQREKITIAELYIDQWESWFFDFNELLKQDRNSGFIVLMIATSFFESHAYFLYGKSTYRNSGPSFVSVFCDIMSEHLQDDEIEAVAEFLYARVRNGLFHMATIKRDVELTAGIKEPFKVTYNSGEIERVQINPYLLLAELRRYLTDDYFQELMEDKDRQAIFNKGWRQYFKDRAMTDQDKVTIDPPGLDLSLKHSGNVTDYHDLGGTALASDSTKPKS